MSRPNLDDLKLVVDGHLKPGTRPGWVRPEPVARSTDPQTSWDAARSVDASKGQSDVLLVMRREGPMTDRRLERVYADYAARGIVGEQSPSGLRTRRKELVDGGYVRDTGRTKKLSSGRKATVWAVTEKVW